ncbi:hypothetical protein MKW92_043169 [Papaver armeniacum]|nr:hypothetical protein MKW92_043169 [Papaver armeniacum]
MNKGDIPVETKMNIKLGISELLEDLEADDNDVIWVSSVPRGGTGLNITIDGVETKLDQQLNLWNLV